MLMKTLPNWQVFLPDIFNHAVDIFLPIWYVYTLCFSATTKADRGKLISTSIQGV